MTNNMDKLITMLGNSPYATGIDISKWNTSFDIDVADRSEVVDILDFVDVRAGYGDAKGKVHTDPRFGVYWNELREHPYTLRGVYWYFSSHSPWERQRDHFFALMEGLDFDYLTLDFENPFNVRSAGFALTAIRFLKAMQAWAPNARVLLYSNKYIYNDWLLRYTSECNEWPYHHAQYPWTNWSTITSYFLSWWAQVIENRTKQPALPKARMGKWEKWQIVAKSGLGKSLGIGSEDVDISIARRPLEQFVEWIGKPKRMKTVEPPPNPMPPHPNMRNLILDEAIRAIEAIQDPPNG